MIPFSGNKVWVSLVAAGLVVGLIATVIFRKASVPTPIAPQEAGRLEPVKKAQPSEVWTCPMHPQIKKDCPGSCPICGMNLVKANAEANDEATTESRSEHSVPDGHAPFKLSLSRQQMIGVRLGSLEKKALYQSIEAAGRVAFDPELYTAQNEYIEALKQQQRVKDSPIADVQHSAKRMLESAKLRLKILGLSDHQIALISASGSTGRNLLIPNPGEMLWVYAEVFEQDLPNIRPGLDAILSGGSLVGRQVVGKVVSIDRVINATTRTAKVRISVPGRKTILRPEAYVDVAIRAPLGEQLVVPMDAVFDTGKAAWVFVVKEDGTFEPRTIGIRYRADDEMAIESGVDQGEKIVTSANFLIDSESRLKSVLAAQTGEPSCPKGQEWNAEMKHCMAKVAE